MSTRDIQAQLQEFYGTEVSPALISKIADKVLKGVQSWQSRALDDVYVVVDRTAQLIKPLQISVHFSLM
jgi:transposase-like protein